MPISHQLTIAGLSEHDAAGRLDTVRELLTTRPPHHDAPVGDRTLPCPRRASRVHCRS